MTDLHRTGWNGLGLEPRGYDEQTMYFRYGRSGRVPLARRRRESVQI